MTSVAAVASHSVKESGFTLVEVIFSLLILAIGVMGIIQGQSGATKVTLRSESMAQALYLAEQKMTEMEILLRSKTFISLPEEEKGEFKDEHFKAFKWNRKLEKVELGCFIPKDVSQGKEGEAQNTAQGYFALVEKIFENAVRKIKVTVEWPEGSKTKSVELTQLYVRYQDLPP